MDDCGTADSAPSADCSSAPDTSTHCSSSVDPPPDYSTCVSHSEPGSSHHHSGTTDTTQHSHNWHPVSANGASTSVTSHVLHDIESSAPFSDVTPGLENRHDEYVPGFNPYNHQPSYNPSYMADKPTTPRPKVYGRKTIVLKRTNAQNSARRRKLIIGLCLGLMIGAIIPIVVLIFMAG